MKQYPGWEQGEGGGIAVGTDTVEPSADPGAAQVQDSFQLHAPECALKYADDAYDTSLIRLGMYS